MSFMHLWLICINEYLKKCLESRGDERAGLPLFIIEMTVATGKNNHSF